MIKKLMLACFFVTQFTYAAMIPNQYWDLNLSRDQIYKLDITGDKYERAIRYQERIMMNLSRNVNALNNVKNKTPEQLQSLAFSMEALSMANDRRGILIMQRNAEMQQYLTPEQLNKLYQNQ